MKSFIEVSEISWDWDHFNYKRLIIGADENKLILNTDNISMVSPRTQGIYDPVKSLQYPITTVSYYYIVMNNGCSYDIAEFDISPLLMSKGEIK